MPTETLHYESARQTQQLFNNDPRNLQDMQEQLGVKATSREGWIKLEGEEEAIEKAKKVFQHLENTLKSGSSVRNREFSHALHIVKHDGVEALQSLSAEKIHTSAKKSMVLPKTVGQ